MLTRALAILVLFAGLAHPQEPKPPELTAEEQKLADEAKKLNEEGVQLYRQGKPADAVAKMRQALEICEKLFPASKYPDGHPDLAIGLNNLASVLNAMGQAKQALPYYRQGLEMTQKLFPAAKYPDVATRLGNVGLVLQAMGQAEQALLYLRQGLEMNRKLFPASKYPDGHLDLARSLNNLGGVLDSMGRAEQALPYYQQSLEMKNKLYPAAKYPDGHPSLALSLNNMGSVLDSMGQAEQALPYYRQGLEMRQKLYPAARYPDGHPDLANGLNNLGAVLNAMGQAEQALPYYHQGLEMRQKLYPTAKYPDGHPELAIGLNNLGAVLNAMGQAEQALPYYRQGLEMRQKLYPTAKYPDGHPELATALNNVGGVRYAMGQAEQALPYFRQGLEMHRKLFPTSKYPDGHPELANSLNNMASVLNAMVQAEQALPYYRQSLEMKQRLFPVAKYPDGHPELAIGLNNLGFVLEAMGQAGQALPYHRQGLEMNRKRFPASKYPDGHLDLARSLNNLGAVLNAIGQAEQALPYYRQSLEMKQRLFPVAKYPDGHPDLAIGLNNLGGVLNSMGRAEQALPYYQQSLEMQQRLSRRELATASEEAAFDKVLSQPLYRDTYLGVTRSVKSPAPEVYETFWPSRSMVTRLLDQRQANARAAGTELGDKLDQLRGLRRRTDRLLQDTKMKPADRDKLLVTLSNERDQLERELVDKIPGLNRWQELDRLGPVDLAKSLPPGAVFVDLIAYTQVEFEKGKRKGIPSYVAFVLAKDRPIQRIELEEAKFIDDAIASWRKAIESRGSAAGATILKERVWDKLAGKLPPGTKTVYVAADGDLARVPWAALPVAKDRVLIEDFAVAQVPHGTFLLDQLKFGKKIEGPESLLTLGGLDYGEGIWPALPGTEVEIRAIAAIAPAQRESLDGKDATPTKLTTTLPKSRYVHLATHGEFNAESLKAERKRAAEALKAREFGGDTRKIAAKNPLGYVGLVISNGEVFSGMSIVDLPLKNTQLVTLSACETGLGDYTAGEGVQGLQRAFHLAGCPNVVASLWKVNDTATAALMAKFYHEMWVNKRAPIEALRQAQLMIYYHPESIPVLAKADRGAPDFKKTIEVEAKPEKAAALNKRTDTKLWAAFVLSGVGK